MARPGTHMPHLARRTKPPSPAGNTGRETLLKEGPPGLALSGGVGVCRVRRLKRTRKGWEQRLQSRTGRVEGRLGVVTAWRGVGAGGDPIGGGLGPCCQQLSGGAAGFRCSAEWAGGSPEQGVLINNSKPGLQDSTRLLTGGAPSHGRGSPPQKALILFCLEKKKYI